MEDCKQLFADISLAPAKTPAESIIRDAYRECLDFRLKLSQMMLGRPLEPALGQVKEELKEEPSDMEDKLALVAGVVAAAVGGEAPAGVCEEKRDLRFNLRSLILVYMRAVGMDLKSNMH